MGKINDLMLYAEEIKTIKFTCSFCSAEEEFERGDFKEQTKTECTKILLAEGWDELTTETMIGIACPACLETGGV